RGCAVRAVARRACQRPGRTTLPPFAAGHPPASDGPGAAVAHHRGTETTELPKINPCLPALLAAQEVDEDRREQAFLLLPILEGDIEVHAVFGHHLVV